MGPAHYRILQFNFSSFAKTYVQLLQRTRLLALYSRSWITKTPGIYVRNTFCRFSETLRRQRPEIKQCCHSKHGTEPKQTSRSFKSHPLTPNLNSGAKCFSSNGDPMIQTSINADKSCTFHMLRTETSGVLDNPANLPPAQCK